jgi:hypothetical protein
MWAHNMRSHAYLLVVIVALGGYLKVNHQAILQQYFVVLRL